MVSQFAELQEQYDAMMQMYGEKVEETEELQLDLQDVKDMYRAQIDDLLVQQRQLTQQLYALQAEGKPDVDAKWEDQIPHFEMVLQMVVIMISWWWIIEK